MAGDPSLADGGRVVADGANVAAGASRVRMVFSDLDSTFLATNKSLVPRNIAVLDRMAELGIQFVPCTGRAAGSIPDALIAHPAVHYAIGCNGACVVAVDEAGERTMIRDVVLGEGRALALYGRLEELGARCTFDLFGETGAVASRERFEAILQMGIDGPNLNMIRSTRRLFDMTTPEVIHAFPQMQKVTMYFGDEKNRALILEAVAADPTIQAVASHPKNLEVTDATASKGQAMEWLATHLGVSCADVVAFGDNPNDISMLRLAGDGVAVSNATDEVRAQADHVTLSNDEAGVGVYLERLLGL